VQVSPFPLWSDADLVVYLATESAQLKLTRCTSSIPAWNTRNCAHWKYRERPPTCPAWSSSPTAAINKLSAALSDDAVD